MLARIYFIRSRPPLTLSPGLRQRTAGHAAPIAAIPACFDYLVSFWKSTLALVVSNLAQCASAAMILRCKNARSGDTSVLVCFLCSLMQPQLFWTPTTTKRCVTCTHHYAFMAALLVLENIVSCRQCTCTPPRRFCPCQQQHVCTHLYSIFRCACCGPPGASSCSSWPTTSATIGPLSSPTSAAAS